MNMNVLRESEVETSALRRAREREPFLRGPISIRMLAAASRLPGRTLAVLLLAHHQTALARKSWVSLPEGILQNFGVDRHAKARALRKLEAAGLVSVRRAKGCAALVSLKTSKASRRSR